MRLSALFGFGKKMDESSELGLLFSRLQKILDGMGEEKLKRVAGFAGLLGKTAYADMHISEVEERRIRTVLKDTLKLADNDIDLILDLLLSHSTQLFSIEDHIYTRFINDVCDKDEKLWLIDALFEVAAADESVSVEEDVTIWNTAKSLLLSHKEFIAARSKHKKHLDVLKS